MPGTGMEREGVSEDVPVGGKALQPHSSGVCLRVPSQCCILVLS